jgi:hypothetical protein
MTFIIARGFRGFCLRSFGIRSSANTDLRRETTRFDGLCTIFLAFIFIGGSVHKRLELFKGDILAGGFCGVLGASQ